jgi:hypothetical protein
MPKPEPILCWLDGIEPFDHDRKHPRRPRRMVRLPPFVEDEMLSDDEVDELRRQVKESAYYRKAFAHLRSALQRMSRQPEILVCSTAVHDQGGRSPA